MTTSARLEMRVDPTLKAAAERAAVLSGARSLTEFVIEAIREKASAVVANHERLRLTDQDFDHFFAACLVDNEPSKRLREATQRHDQAGYR